MSQKEGALHSVSHKEPGRPAGTPAMEGRAGQESGARVTARSTRQDAERGASPLTVRARHWLGPPCDGRGWEGMGVVGRGGFTVVVVAHEVLELEELKLSVSLSTLSSPFQLGPGRRVMHHSSIRCSTILLI